MNRTAPALRIAIGLVSTLALLGLATSTDAAQTWTKYAGNPIITERGDYQPEVVKVGGTYHMFFTFRNPPGGPYTTIEVRHRTSSDGITWSAATTVLTEGTAGAWDDSGVYVDSVIYDAGTFKMWYTGRKVSPSSNEIGYATSPDGTTWTKYAGNPVVTRGGSGAWDSQYVREAAVVKLNGTYHMWYAGTDSWPAFKIGYATSPDGTTWTKNAANPVLLPGSAGSWDDATVYGPQVVDYGGFFHMWYSGGDGASDNTWEVGYAASCDYDGVNWTKEPGNPVIGLGAPPAWDCGDSVDYNYVMNDGGTWKMWYSGAGFRCGHPDDYQIGYATLSGPLPVPPAPTCDADLGVTKSVDNATPLLGTNVVFTVTVTNNGPCNADGVTLSDPLPAGLTYVSDDGGGAYNPGTGVWTIGHLDLSASVTLHITATASALGTLVNTATVSIGSPEDPNPSNDQASATVTVQAPSPTPTPSAPPSPIPTTSGSGLIVFMSLLALAGAAILWRWRN